MKRKCGKCGRPFQLLGTGKAGRPPKYCVFHSIYGGYGKSDTIKTTSARMRRKDFRDAFLEDLTTHHLIQELRRRMKR